MNYIKKKSTPKEVQQKKSATTNRNPYEMLSILEGINIEEVDYNIDFS